MLLGIENKRVEYVNLQERSYRLLCGAISNGHMVRCMELTLWECCWYSVSCALVYAWVVCNPLNRDAASMMDGMMEVFGTLVSTWSDV